MIPDRIIKSIAQLLIITVLGLVCSFSPVQADKIDPDGSDGGSGGSDDTGAAVLIAAGVAAVVVGGILLLKGGGDKKWEGDWDDEEWENDPEDDEEEQTEESFLFPDAGLSESIAATRLLTLSPAKSSIALYVDWSRCNERLETSYLEIDDDYSRIDIGLQLGF